MKIKFDNLKSRRYFLLFVFVMVLNVSLTVILLRVSFSQTQKEDFSSQQPVKVEVTEQKNNPLKIVVVNVDTSDLFHQEIICSLQNVGSKSIRSYTLLADGKNTGRIITSFFATKMLQQGEPKINSVPLERQSIKEGETVLLSIDYVEFEDGSFWGEDSRGKSKALAGQREGTKAAIKQMKDLFRDQDSGSVANLLKDIEQTTVNVPDVSQSDEWKRGFRLGYKSVSSILQGIEEQKIENLIKKLDEMEKLLIREVRIQ